MQPSKQRGYRGIGEMLEIVEVETGNGDGNRNHGAMSVSDKLKRTQ